MFLLYAVLYLAIGLLLDWSMSLNTKVQWWSVLAWPFLLCLTVYFHIRQIVLYFVDHWRKDS